MDLVNHHVRLTEPMKVRQPIFLTVIWCGAGVSLVFLCGRVFARLNLFKKLSIEDILVICAWILSLATAIGSQLLASDAYEFFDVTSGQVFPPPTTFYDAAERYRKAKVAAWALFFTTLWLVKGSFLIFFWRLSENVTGQKALWWAVAAFTAATYLVCIGTIEYKTLQGSTKSFIAEGSSPAAICSEKLFMRINCAWDVASDYFIMAIPFNLLRRVRISPQKKIALAGVFSLTIITTVFAIVRVALIGRSAYMPEMSWTFMWNSIEASVAIIVACLASYPNLFKRSKVSPSHDATMNRLVHSARKTTARIARRPHKSEGSAILAEISRWSSSVEDIHTSPPSNDRIPQAESQNRSLTLMEQADTLRRNNAEDMV